jgi:predicted RNA-binding protein with PUA domain
MSDKLTNSDYIVTDADYIAWCKMCTLAEVMKDCKNCKFNIGLPFRLIKAEEIKNDAAIKARVKNLLDVKKEG